MKKKILFIVLSLFVTCSIFAKNDIELNIGFMPQPVNIINHNYFGEKQIFGFGEAISFGPALDPYIGVLIGPSVRQTVTKNIDFQLISGFKFYYSSTKHISYGSLTDIEIQNNTINTGYAWGNDLQFKFAANNIISFVTGASFSIGQLYTYYIQKPVDKKGIAVYKPISGKTEKSMINDFEPYIGLSINIK